MARLSERIVDLHPSPVRAMLAASQQSDVISFAGGLPAPDSFEDLELAAPPRSLLQYGPSEGEPELRRRISEQLAEIGLGCPPDRVLVLSGSQQGIDLVAKLVADQGTPIAVEQPTYLAALQVFRFFGAELGVFDRSQPGAAWRRSGKPAAAFVTPTFQNPTGACWSLEEREALARACDEDDVLLFEDDPYRDLAYDECGRRPVAGFVRRASWVYQGSFSKSVAPGLRLGFLAASADVFPYIVRLKQAADLHTNRLSQWIVLRHLEDPQRPHRLRRLVDRYRRRRDAFEAALSRRLAGRAAWSKPPGGLFFWATLDGPIDSALLLDAAARRGVLFTPGVHFMVESGRANASVRLNFSHAEEARAERGLEILAELLAEVQPAAPSATSLSISASP
jgi:2-aminoadipate transaminase